MNETQKFQEKKKAPKWFVILFTVAILVLIGKCVSGDSKSEGENEKRTATDTTSWSNMNYEQQEAWLTDYLESPGPISITVLKNAIKRHFEFPEEVDFPFEFIPSLQRGRIVDAETGTVFVEGQGTGKNAFGVKQGFNYAIRLKITKDSAYIDNVSVNPMK